MRQRVRGSVGVCVMALVMISVRPVLAKDMWELRSPDGSALLRVAPQGVAVSRVGDPSGPGAEYQTTEPVQLEVLETSGATTWLSGSYSSVSPKEKGGLHARASLNSPAGTKFDIQDDYSRIPGSTFLMRRYVSVTHPSPRDKGFMSRFSLSSRVPSPREQQEFFIPGICYLDNQHVPSGALAGDLSEESILVREDRMPLPLVMMRNIKTGATLSLVHSHPDESSCLADYVSGAVVDSRIRTCSLGMLSPHNSALAFCYPGTEGERTYLPQPAGTPRDGIRRGWARRFHPMVSYSYTPSILIDLSRHSDFVGAMRHAWRLAFNIQPPRILQAPVADCYHASLDLVTSWSINVKGCQGLPFRLKLPKGELETEADMNYQMGFVGQQIPLAAHLVRYGLEEKRSDVYRKGAAMVDFWAANSLFPDGLPRTWYDTHPDPHWRRYNTFLRVASDGMNGALAAWSAAARHGLSKPQWLAFCRGFGDWLIQHQNADGTWCREYDWNSKPANDNRHNTCHPIRYLVDLYYATGERKYLDAALRAGEWCFENEHRQFIYIGGTADNPNVTDKEAGVMAMDAYLALHDVTGSARWLQAAVQAADFAETWVYCRDIPIPSDDTSASYPPNLGTAGFSLIATGHSGADLFMAGAAFQYYRLYLATGDPHYADVAALLLHNTRQAMNLPGYGHKGLCPEAMSFAPPRGHGVNVWLPWVSYSMMEPVIRLQQAFGMMDTPKAEGKRLEELMQRNRDYGKSRGISAADP